MDRYIGRMLDNRYEILEEIGSGGMAVVYKARCHRLNRLVAIKILKDENLQDQDFRRRFHAESQAVAMLSHPNIVSVHDVSMDSDEDYIVMELIEGISLKQYMEKRGVLNWKETLHFAIQIAKALDHAHSKGLVHRDIKPHNVMVLRTGAVKVADFGIARMMSKSNTLTKEALGSVHYISPEQARGGRVDNRSDIYSLGVVMYEMITGRVPYDGESPVSVAIQHINGGALKPSEINPGIPAALEQIICKAMATNPRDRYANAAEMFHDMDEFRKDPTMVRLPVAADQDISAPVDPPQPHQPEEPEGMPLLVPKRKTAPKPAQKETPPEKPRDYATSERRRSTITTVAVVLCSVLIMVAVIFSLSLLLREEEPEAEKSQVTVPNLMGMYYSGLTEYDDVEIVFQKEEYNSTYPAGQIIRQQPEAGEQVDYGTKVYVIVSKGPKPVSQDITMINLVGKTEEDARQWLLDQGVDQDRIKIIKDYSATVPAGCVMETDPIDGDILPASGKIKLTISLGKETAVMPDLAGRSMSLSSARLKMENDGFTNVQYLPVNSELTAGTIVSQSVEAGEAVTLDTAIVITYSNGIAPDTPPVTIFVELTDLPEMAEDYLLSIVSNGQILLLDYTVEAGQTALTLELSGVGTMECQVYVNGVLYQTITLDFIADDQT